jgi:hypothetical protein
LLFTPPVVVSRNQSVDCELLNVDTKDVVGAEAIALAGTTQLADSKCGSVHEGDICGVSAYPFGLGVGRVHCEFNVPTKKVRAALSVHSTVDSDLQVVVPATK